MMTRLAGDSRTESDLSDYTFSCLRWQDMIVVVIVGREWLQKKNGANSKWSSKTLCTHLAWASGDAGFFGRNAGVKKRARHKFSNILRRQTGEGTVSRFLRIEVKRPKRKRLDESGIEPETSPMLRERATDYATRPGVV